MRLLDAVPTIWIDMETMRVVLRTLFFCVPRPIRKGLRALLSDRFFQATAKVVSEPIKPPPASPPATLPEEPLPKDIGRLLFNTSWYIDHYPEAPSDHEEAYRSYLAHGRMAGHRPSPLFANLTIPARVMLPEQHLFRVTTSPVFCRVPPARYLELYQPETKRGVRHPSSTLAEYLQRAMIRPDLIGPNLSEFDLRIAAYMDGVKNGFTAEYTGAPQDDLISIIMVAQKSTELLPDAIISVLMQSHEHWELIVANVGGDQEVEAVLRQFQDSRIKVVYVGERCPLGQARNACLEHASGHLFAYLDASSLWDPDCLLILSNRIRASGARASYGAQALWDGFDPSARLGSAFEAIRFLPFNRSLIENRDYLPTTVLVHDRFLLEEVGSFDASLIRHVDWDWILRMTEATRPEPVPCLLGHRFRVQQALPPAVEELGESIADDAEAEETALHKVRARLVARSDWSQPFTTTDGKEHLAFSLSTRTRNDRRRKLAMLPVESVQILIPNYESVSELEMCLASISEHTSSPYNVTVIDNGSPEDTYIELERMIASFDHVEIIRETASVGFSFAVNRGLVEIADKSEKILILNNDTLATPDWLDELRYVLFKHEDAGMAVPRQIIPAGSRALKLHMPSADTRFECDINLSTQHDNILDPEFDRDDDIVELSFAPLFCGLIRPETIRALGGLDSRNGPHYRSDWILCEAIRRVRGQRILYTPHSKVYHLQGVATAKRNASASEISQLGQS